jgi:peptide/nickel transport system permease protein
VLKGYRKYFLNKLGWFLITLVCAFVLNFVLPRLMPGDPVAPFLRMAQGLSDARAFRRFISSTRVIRHQPAHA